MYIVVLYTEFSLLHPPQPRGLSGNSVVAWTPLKNRWLSQPIQSAVELVAPHPLTPPLTVSGNRPLLWRLRLTGLRGIRVTPHDGTSCGTEMPGDPDRIWHLGERLLATNECQACWAMLPTGTAATPEWLGFGRDVAPPGGIGKSGKQSVKVVGNFRWSRGGGRDQNRRPSVLVGATDRTTRRFRSGKGEFDHRSARDANRFTRNRSNTAAV